MLGCTVYMYTHYTDYTCAERILLGGMQELLLTSATWNHCWPFISNVKPLYIISSCDFFFPEWIVLQLLVASRAESVVQLETVIGWQIFLLQAVTHSWSVRIVFLWGYTLPFRICVEAPYQDFQITETRASSLANVGKEVMWVFWVRDIFTGLPLVHHAVPSDAAVV